MILLGKNENWRDSFVTIFSNDKNREIEFDQRKLIIKSFVNPHDFTYEKWCLDLNGLLETYLDESFHYEQISYSQDDYFSIYDLITKLEEAKTSYQIDYIDMIDKSKLFLLALKSDIEDFFQRNQNLKHLSKIYRSSGSPSSIYETSIGESKRSLSTSSSLEQDDEFEDSLTAFTTSSKKIRI
jgi:hypothetical protein